MPFGIQGGVLNAPGTPYDQKPVQTTFINLNRRIAAGDQSAVADLKTLSELPQFHGFGWQGFVAMLSMMGAGAAVAALSGGAAAGGVTAGAVQSGTVPSIPLSAIGAGTAQTAGLAAPALSTAASVAAPAAATAAPTLMQRLLPQVVAGGTSIVGGILTSNAAKDAANTQSDAALEAAKLQAKTGEDALAFDKDVFAQQQKNLQPWIDAGTGALTQLKDMTATPYKLPSYDEAMQDPGIQFALQEGQRVLDASLKSKNLSLSGKAVKETQSRAMGIASTGYGDVVNRSLAERNANLNPLFSLAGLGQQGTTQMNSNLNTLGTNNANISMATANNVGNQQTSAAAARAAGSVASGNIWGGVAGSVGSNFMDDYYMQQMLKRIPLNQMG